MTKWIVHDEIAGMMGTPCHISNEINRFVDDINPPSEFELHNTDKKIPFGKRGISRISLRQLATLLSRKKEHVLHDRMKNKHIIAKDLKWLLQSNRTEYIKPYYLHFIVDYINDGYMASETVVDCINRWERKRAIFYTVLGSDQHLRDVLDFIKNNGESILSIMRNKNNALSE